VGVSDRFEKMIRRLGGDRVAGRLIDLKKRSDRLAECLIDLKKRSDRLAGRLIDLKK
jgi:hypothetical protein